MSHVENMSRIVEALRRAYGHRAEVKEIRVDGDVVRSIIRETKRLSPARVRPAATDRLQAKI